ncbi:NAD-dependent epimerase/dehydratase family protein [Sinomicrobium weinanense]|uniref:NAD-dependent epimerase/dehydratase family protein n=1 Tax=Sinomicrobium weinanense TaxID=2842200 RepID=A0A926JQU8_9FLAO|nr:NAD-dependent epimerase/dehydratase family protein [Sinomicrobium weinanense]MBC9795629.1 NAD-dependent epimerase/dehydratase family protein [Sinomicrobium weinanense]MBU3124650.1 NAD-dependent epimerase/dehydratase family protein [Sinomicrobium weinanense]
MTEKTVLVTGANGFLGNHIARVLLQRGFRVIAMVRPASNISALNGLNCTICRGELHNTDDVTLAVKKADYVIHCASMTSQNTTDFTPYKKANFTSTELLVRACEQHHIRRFVLVSTANCFTNGTISDPGNEESGFMNWLKDSGYAYSKYLAQKYVLDKARKNSFPAVVVAPTFMTGPYDTRPSSGALMLYALKKKVLFYPKGGKSFVDVRAAAIATVNALTLGRTGECYLLSGTNLSYKAYFKKVLDVAGQRKWLIPIPGFTKTAFGLAHRIFPSKRLRLLKTHVRMLSLDNYFSNAKARKHLNMRDTDINESINNAVNWFKSEGYF